MAHVCIITSLQVGDQLHSLRCEASTFDAAVMKAARAILALNRADFTRPDALSPYMCHRCRVFLDAPDEAHDCEPLPLSPGLPVVGVAT